MATLRETIKTFMAGKKGGVASLKEIHEGVLASGYKTNGKTLECSERTVIYRHPEEFKALAKGLYVLTGEHSSSLLINGDSRGLQEIEDGSIDAIITDHPWEDKKAHKSGNQKGFAEYDTFRYTVEDFKQKARVMKEGAYLVEFVPVESSTNYEYLYEIKQMAKACGLQYYTHCIWRNAPEGSVNTGKTTKGVQQLLFFTKGKPRKLSRAGVNAYQTREILNYEIEMFLKNKDKHHQAEKPVALYEYLVKMLTDEKDVVLDQFGGSCNLMQACVNTNRFGVVYELSKDFVDKAVERFKATPLYENGAILIEEVKKEVSKIAAPVKYLSDDDYFNYLQKAM